MIIGIIYEENFRYCLLLLYIIHSISLLSLVLFILLYFCLYFILLALVSEISFLFNTSIINLQSTVANHFAKISASRELQSNRILCSHIMLVLSCLLEEIFAIIDSLKLSGMFSYTFIW